MRQFPHLSIAQFVAVALILVASNDLVRGDDDRNISQWIDDLSRDYNEKTWVEKPKFRPLGYMRPIADKGWQTRMLALHAVVQQGKAAIPTLVEAMKSGDEAQREFAAQALGYLGEDVPAAPLLKAARKDTSKAVRLYAVDSLGMRGGAGGAVDWESLKKGERDRDVLKHIGYAVERQDTSVKQTVITTLKNWDPKTINTAVVGKPAPDFELLSATDQQLKLSDFRGKKSVVLVFVYGDT